MLDKYRTLIYSISRKKLRPRFAPGIPFFSSALNPLESALPDKPPANPFRFRTSEKHQGPPGVSKKIPVAGQFEFFLIVTIAGQKFKLTRYSGQFDTLQHRRYYQLASADFAAFAYFHETRLF